MDDNQLDKFFRDQIGDFEEAHFDESAWEAIAPAVQTLTPRPYRYRFWGNWPVVGGAVILSFLLGGMGYVIFHQSRELNTLKNQLSLPKPENTDTLWCENVIFDTLWVPVFLPNSGQSGVYVFPGYSNTSYDSPISASLPSGHTMGLLSDRDTIVQGDAAIVLPDAEDIVLWVQNPATHSDSVAEIEQRPGLPPALSLEKQKKNKKPIISGIKAGLFTGLQLGMVKNGEHGGVPVIAAEGELAFNPQWSVITQPGFSPINYEMHLNPFQPGFDIIYDNLPNKPMLEEPANLYEIKMHGSWIMLPVGVKHTFFPEKNIRPYAYGGVMAIKVLHQNFVYEYLNNNVGQTMIAPTGPSPWTVNSIFLGGGMETTFSKHWMAALEMRYSPPIAGQGAEKRLYQLFGAQVGMGYIIK
ncbi:MAG: hypothetical protein R3C61_09635 [Bacteroidia bacterium]